jgi:hypothetical protein
MYLAIQGAGDVTYITVSVPAVPCVDGFTTSARGSVRRTPTGEDFCLVLSDPSFHYARGAPGKHQRYSNDENVFHLNCPFF